MFFLGKLCKELGVFNVFVRETLQGKGCFCCLFVIFSQSNGIFHVVVPSEIALTN